MDREAIIEHLEREPFAPFALRLPSGRELEITNPELVMFNESGRTLIVAQGERVIIINVATVEMLDTAAADD